MWNRLPLLSTWHSIGCRHRWFNKMISKLQLHWWLLISVLSIDIYSFVAFVIFLPFFRDPNSKSRFLLYLHVRFQSAISQYHGTFYYIFFNSLALCEIGLMCISTLRQTSNLKNYSRPDWPVYKIYEAINVTYQTRI